MNSNKRDVYFNGRIYQGVDTKEYSCQFPNYFSNFPSYELIGTHNFTSGQCVDGLYELEYQWQTDYKNMGKKWEDCTPTVYSMANHFYRRIVAVALPTPAPVAELPKEAEGKWLEANRRNPLSDVLGSFQSEPMFPYIIEAWDHYVNKVLPEHRTAHGLFKYLLKLERGIELRNQKHQPV